MTHTQATENARKKHRRRRPDGGDYALFASITVLGAALDLWSKHAVFAWLGSAPTPDYSVIDGFLRLIRAENAGAAFSLFPGMTWVFVAVSIIALFVIQILFWKGKLIPRLTLTAVSCMNAGVIGNLYDRLFNEGRVRDFIDVYIGSYHWPTFNVADSLLCIGVGILIIFSLTVHEKQ